MKPLHHIAAIAALVAATFGAGKAAAAPTSANPLSSYIGQCVAFFTTEADLGSAFGLLRAAEDEYVELELFGVGYPTFVYMSHVTVAMADPSGSCLEQASISIRELLERSATKQGE